MGNHGSRDVPDGTAGSSETKLRGRYTSHMSGFMESGGSKYPCDLNVIIETDDVIHMIERCDRQEARINGEINCSLLSKDPVLFSAGRFFVLSSGETNLHFKSMVYQALLPLGENGCFFEGKRLASDISFNGNNAADDSSLNIVIKNGPNHTDETFTTGQVSAKLVDIAKELTDIEITGSEDDEKLKMEWKAKFGFFLGGVLLTISDIFSPTEFCPKTSARERRHLDTKGIKPTVYNLTATDGVPLLMTRYKCGNKGPILLLHGLCVTSRIFSLDTIDKNFVEFLCEHGYDIWLLELRLSVALPSHQKSSRMHDPAGKDLPPAIDLIIKESNSPDIQVLGHCIGSITTHVALLGGHIDRRKIRCFIASQVGFSMISSAMNQAKAKTRLDNIAVAFGYKGLTAYTDKNDHAREKFMSAVSNALARTTLNKENQCGSVVCHRITAMFGLMWEHPNMNEETHHTLSEWFGFGHADYYHHLSVAFRKGRLVDPEGKDVYLPDFNSKNRLESPLYRKAMKKMDIPILYFVGSLNKAWEIDASRDSYQRVKDANPDQYYEWFEAPTYGHLDCIIGKNAAEDVFPRLLTFLDKYALPEMVWEGNDHGTCCYKSI
ncbi:uncharacterized protein LOC121414195 isoform X1 [Lytechinus variegatus]|uniref:uncharacterized protein LOC121414195 isoform X1 n=1 Tax=Lytechinus variegatus TaxID=7654 RepID=UPI001BB12EAA|nr:uncharacterized protein LOC121414195 isoform X1 [Lytechinus variegatus]